MAKLLKNGNILAMTSVLDEATQMLLSVPVEFKPSDQDYEKWMHWLATDIELKRAKKLRVAALRDFTPVEAPQGREGLPSARAARTQSDAESTRESSRLGRLRVNHSH